MGRIVRERRRCRSKPAPVAAAPPRPPANLSRAEISQRPAVSAIGGARTAARAGMPLLRRSAAPAAAAAWRAHGIGGGGGGDAAWGPCCSRGCCRLRATAAGLKAHMMAGMAGCEKVWLWSGAQGCRRRLASQRRLGGCQLLRWRHRTRRSSTIVRGARGPPAHHTQQALAVSKPGGIRRSFQPACSSSRPRSSRASRRRC